MARFAVQYEVRRDGETLLHGTLGEKESLTIGPDRALIPCADVKQTFSLLVAAGNGFGIRLDQPLRGELIASGRRLRVDDGLLCDPRPEPLLFGDGDRGQLAIGDGLDLRFSIIAQRRTFRLFGQLDWSFGSAMAAAATVIFAAYAVVSALDPHQGISSRRLVRLTIAPKSLLPPPSPRAKAKATKQKTGRKAAAAARQQARPRGRHLRRRRFARRTLSKRPHRQRNFSKLLAALDDIPKGGKKGSALAVNIAKTDALLTSAITPRTVLGGGLNIPALTRRLRLKAPRPSRPKALTRSPGTKNPSREAIAKVVARGSGTIRHCFERELLLGGDAIHGRIVVRWKIDATGKPTRAKIVRDGVRNASIRRCILKALASWRFPGCPERSCEVVYPFEFYLRS